MMNTPPHRIFVPSTRLTNWDYTSCAWYYVTICTQNRQPFLGEVKTGCMNLSTAGDIVEEEWKRTAEVRHNVTLDEFVLMPDHLHAIIVITESMSHATHRVASTSVRPRLYANSLGSIIGQFKSVATKRIRDAGHPDFAWQPRFYDHIIRDEASLYAIRKYILDNPMKWAVTNDDAENLPLNFELGRRDHDLAARCRV